VRYVGSSRRSAVGRGVLCHVHTCAHYSNLPCAQDPRTPVNLHKSIEFVKLYVGPAAIYMQSCCKLQWGTYMYM
jgi:hypothetical protein